MITEGSPKTDKLESEESASTDLKKSCSDELIQKAMSSPVVAPALLKTEMILKPPQDVDLRVLPTSPKKRVSDNKSEEPPTKKNKAEMYNMYVIIYFLDHFAASSLFYEAAQDFCVDNEVVKT